MAEEEDVTLRFNVHGDLDGVTLHFMSLMRRTYAETARELTTRLPPSRELSTAITKLEEAMFWTSAAITRFSGRPKGYGDSSERYDEARVAEMSPDGKEKSCPKCSSPGVRIFKKFPKEFQTHSNGIATSWCTKCTRNPPVTREQSDGTTFDG